MPPDRTVRGHSCAQCFFSGVSQCWWQEEQLPPQPSPFQPPCREIHTTASANRTASTSKVMIPRAVIIKRPLFRKNSNPSIHHLPPESNRKALPAQTFSKNENLGLHLASRSDIISVFRFGGLAQLVRAPASHAGGLGFESLILHHTVRTRTRFFMKKGSGTFLFAGGSEKGLLGTVNEQRQGITMTVVSCLLFCGIKFALCELGRPHMAHWGQSLHTCVPGRACTPLARCNTLDFVPKSVC